MKVRCVCTMEEVAPGFWRKPEAGYKAPKRDCSFCWGMSFQELPEIGGILWIGRCPFCGEQNGGYLVREGDPRDEPPQDDRPPCLNKKCDNEFCDWVQVIED